MVLGVELTSSGGFEPPVQSQPPPMISPTMHLSPCWTVMVAVPAVAAQIAQVTRGAGVVMEAQSQCHESGEPLTG